jgi:hypothetical protein
MFPLWFTLLGGFICVLGGGSFHFVLCFSFLFILGPLVSIWLAGIHHLVSSMSFVYASPKNKKKKS